MRTIHIIGVLVATFAFTATAQAQFQHQNRVSGLTYRGQSMRSAILSQPTVSPYLALVDLNGTGAIDPSRQYFSFVRPRIERDAQQRRQQLQIQNLQQNVADMRSAAARQNQQRGRITGHPTRFNYYLQYYPTLNRR